MFIEEELKKYGDKNIRVYLDMDGTIVHYDIDGAYDYDKKRPLLDRIDKVKYLNDNYPNITFYILSICHEKKQIDEKNIWLDKYLPYIEKDNRVIIVRDPKGLITSGDVKRNYLNQLDTKDTIILIDDDVRILKAVKSNNRNHVVLYKDSILSD